MRKSVLGVMLLIAVQSASAAIQYEFRQTTTSDAEGTQPSDCGGRAFIDGEKSRVEFIDCNSYTPGTFVLTTNGSRILTFVDPTKKSYVEVNAGAVAAALGTTKITIANKKVNTTEMPDHPVIAGIPTDHYRLTLDYDITITFGNLPLTQTVHTIIDRWTTMAFGDLGETFLSGGVLHTGNPDIDELVAVENAKGRGFPLKQTVQTTMINNRAKESKSKLSVNRTTTVTREMIVTSVTPVAALAASTFHVPAGYRRAEPVRDDTQKAPMQTISMEPAGH
jgi:hypothetical protein